MNPRCTEGQNSTTTRRPRKLRQTSPECLCNQGTYTSITWLPHRNKLFADSKQATDTAGNPLADSKYWCNFNGFDHLGMTGPRKDLANPARTSYLVSTNQQGRRGCLQITGQFLHDHFVHRQILQLLPDPRENCIHSSCGVSWTTLHSWKLQYI